MLLKRFSTRSLDEETTAEGILPIDGGGLTKKLRKESPRRKIVPDAKGGGEGRKSNRQGLRGKSPCKLSSRRSTGIEPILKR